jgi:hypothetical protein
MAFVSTTAAVHVVVFGAADDRAVSVHDQRARARRHDETPSERRRQRSSNLARAGVGSGGDYLTAVRGSGGPQ